MSVRYIFRDDEGSTIDLSMAVAIYKCEEPGELRPFYYAAVTYVGDVEFRYSFRDASLRDDWYKELKDAWRLAKNLDNYPVVRVVR